MLNFPDKKYKVIYADPPWAFATYSEKGEDRSAKKHYNTMSLEDIKNLPVQNVADKDCALLLWVTYPLLKEGIATMEAWGFTYKTCGFCWAKKNAKGPGFFMGNGYISRANTELCLYGSIGSPKVKARDVRQLVVTRRREHSRKPDEVYGRIERLFDGPYLEMFCRTSVEGWDAWGNEVGKFNPAKK